MAVGGGRIIFWQCGHWCVVHTLAHVGSTSWSWWVKGKEEEEDVKLEE